MKTKQTNKKMPNALKQRIVTAVDQLQWNYPVLRAKKFGQIFCVID